MEKQLELLLLLSELCGCDRAFLDRAGDSHLDARVRLANAAMLDRFGSFSRNKKSYFFSVFAFGDKSGAALLSLLRGALGTHNLTREGLLPGQRHGDAKAKG